MKKISITFLLIMSILSAGCAKKINEDDPIDVIKNFILLCEAGDIKDAEKLLAPKNNVDYFDKYKNLNGGKDLIYIGHDYKGNDDVIELKFELIKNLSSKKNAVVKMTSNYLKQHHSFEKVIMLTKVDGKWRIHDYELMPVKVN